MTLMPSKKPITVGLFLFLFFNISLAVLSQESSVNVSGSASVTNEGISIVPALSLGEPASIFNLSVGRRLRFEPELRFSLEGKPWSFLFWFRYDVVTEGKFYLRLGAHPAISFRSTDAIIGGVSDEVITARRFLAGELNSGYRISDNWSVGTYYLFSHGADPNVPDFTNFVSLNSLISNISLFGDLFLNLSPQVYYLKIDDIDGFYIASSTTLGKRNFPFSISSIINHTLKTEIKENPELLWNVSLNYSFNF